MAKKKQAQHHTRKKNGALAAMENNFEEKLMATIHSSKVNIEPLKKEPDTNAKRFVRSDEEEKKKSPEKKEEVKKKSPAQTRDNQSRKQEISSQPQAEHIKAEEEKPEDKRRLEEENRPEQKVVSRPKKEEKEDVPKYPKHQAATTNASPAPMTEPEIDDEEETQFTGTSFNNLQGIPYLVNAASGERTYIYTLPFSIGKRTSCNLSIRSNIVSREHARIVSDGVKYFVIDMGSKNGTYLNGFQIPPSNEIEIKNGQTIIFANEKFIFHE